MLYSNRKRGASIYPEWLIKLQRSSPLIKTAAGVGLLALAVVGSSAAPTATLHITKALFQMYKLMGKPKSAKAVEIQSQRVLYYLKRTGSVRFREAKGARWIALTALGRQRLKQTAFENLIIVRPKAWDGKWWLVAADIPTKEYRVAANLLRAKLVEIGFKPLQRTMWLHPFDPREVVDEIVRHYGVERFVTVMEINRLDVSDEEFLLSHFRKQKIL